MNMLAVYVTEDRKFHVGEFRCETPRWMKSLIQTHFSTISVGTEIMALRGIRDYGEFSFVLGLSRHRCPCQHGTRPHAFPRRGAGVLLSNTMDLFLGNIESGTTAQVYGCSHRGIVRHAPIGLITVEMTACAWATVLPCRTALFPWQVLDLDRMPTHSELRTGRDPVLPFAGEFHSAFHRGAPAVLFGFGLANSGFTK